MAKKYEHGVPQLVESRQSLYGFCSPVHGPPAWHSPHEIDTHAQWTVHKPACEDALARAWQPTRLHKSVCPSMAATPVCGTLQKHHVHLSLWVCRRAIHGTL